MLRKPVSREDGGWPGHLSLRSSISLIVLVALLAACWSRPARADNLDPDQIKAILRTATPAEDRFIDRTVHMVKAGKLPADMFESTLQWARRKTRNRFQYFKRALILRAADAGITLKG